MIREGCLRELEGRGEKKHQAVVNLKRSRSSVSRRQVASAPFKGASKVCLQNFETFCKAQALDLCVLNLWMTSPARGYVSF